LHVDGEGGCAADQSRCGGIDAWTSIVLKTALGIVVVGFGPGDAHLDRRSIPSQTPSAASSFESKLGLLPTVLTIGTPRVGGMRIPFQET
jgi:hypothetical protein